MTVQRLTFLSAGFAPESDSQGEHLLKLAGEFSRRGVRCSVLAVKSRTTQHPEAIDLPTGFGSMKVVRLPAAMPGRERLRQAAATLADLAPDWISMHFVCYGFNRKGVVFSERHWLPRLLRAYRVHLLAHELWVGHPAYDTLRNRFWRTLQKPCILSLLRRINPRVLDVTNPYWAELLEAEGIHAGILPLFSPLPVGEASAEAWLWPVLREAGVPIDTATRDRYWIFGMIGAPPQWWPIDALLKELVRIGTVHGRKIVVASIGRERPLDHQGERLRRLFPEIAFVMLGEKPGETISQFMNSIDFGLNQTPHYLIGKSGIAACMTEHGVPVIANWGDLEPGRTWISTPLAHLVWPFDPSLERRLVAHQRSHPRIDMLKRVVDQMLAEFAAAD